MSSDNLHSDPLAVFEAREAEMMSLASGPTAAPPATLAAASAERQDINSAIRDIEGQFSVSKAPTYSSYNAGETLDGSAGVVASARSQGTGSPRMPDELTPDDLVTVPGMGEMTVRGAVALGLIAKDQGGTYRDTQEAPQPAEKAPEKAPAAEPERFSDDDMEACFTVAEQHSTLDTRVAAMNDVIKTGEISRNTIVRAASEMGIQPHEAQALFDRVADAFDGQAREAIGKFGIADVDAFVQWAAQNRAGDFRQAMQQHYLQRSTAGYRSVVHAFQAAHGNKSPGAKAGQKLANGVTTHKSADGRGVMVHIPGVGMTNYATAARLGYVKA